MQLKLIEIRGQCRGRPPNSYTSRDGPVFSRQLTVDSLQLLVSSRWPAVSNRKPGYWSRGSTGGTAVKRRRYKKWWVLIPLPGIVTPLPKISLARDWVPFTCSVRPKITQDRNKDRLHTIVEPAERSRKREVCQVVNT